MNISKSSKVTVVHEKYFFGDSHQFYNLSHVNGMNSPDQDFFMIWVFPY